MFFFAISFLLTFIHYFVLQLGLREYRLPVLTSEYATPALEILFGGLLPANLVPLSFSGHRHVVFRAECSEKVMFLTYSFLLFFVMIFGGERRLFFCLYFIHISFFCM